MAESLGRRKGLVPASHRGHPWAPKPFCPGGLTGAKSCATSSCRLHPWTLQGKSDLRRDKTRASPATDSPFATASGLFADHSRTFAPDNFTHLLTAQHGEVQSARRQRRVCGPQLHRSALHPHLLDPQPEPHRADPIAADATRPHLSPHHAANFRPVRLTIQSSILCASPSELTRTALYRGVLISGVLGAYTAAMIADDELQSTPALTYLALTSSFLVTAGDIGITLALYLSTIASLYVGLGRTTWWKLLRLDAPVGGALLLILDIAFFGRMVALAAGATSTRIDRRGILWLPVIIELTLLIITLGAFCAVLYTMSKLKKRGETHVVAMGKIPTLLLAATSIWVVRCCYNTAVTVKAMLPSWTEDELNAQLILIPIFEVFLGAAVLALLTIVLRKAVWADASLHPTTTHPAPVMMGHYQQQPSQYPQPPAGYEQHSSQYPQQTAGYQQPPQYGYPQPQAAPYYSDATVQQQPHIYNK